MLIGDAKRHSVRMLPLDIQQSESRCTLVDGAIRLGLPRAQIERLIAAAALGGWGIARRPLLWELGTIRYAEAELDLPIPTAVVELPAQSRAEAFAREIAALGLSNGDHVMTFYRAWLDAQGIHSSVTLDACDDGQRVRVAGLCVVHQARLTAKGFQFLTLEDKWVWQM